MYTGREFQVDGVETEKACEEQLVVTTIGTYGKICIDGT